MGYIITATVLTGIEINKSGIKSKVKARTLMNLDDGIIFDIKGEYGKQAELTKQLCETLIDAGFYAFEIHHSY